jgi:coniferyl-aldehyde dehydrogenase
LPVFSDLRMIVATMRRQQLAAGFPDAALRRDRLERVARLIDENHAALAAAAAADRGFGTDVTVPAGDLVTTLASLNHSARHLADWMAQEPCGVDRGPVTYWPLGVIGVIAPWTHPVSLALAPLAGILAAGNVAMIKLSHHAPRSSDLLADLVGHYFGPCELGVVLGDDAVGAAFAELPLAQLVFTGSARAARSVAATAAARLMPVIYAVGGKSPALVSADADPAAAARYIMAAKLRNGGQSSRAVDHVLVARSLMDAFVAHAREQGTRILDESAAAGRLFPASVRQIHQARLAALVADAQNHGAQRICLGSTHAAVMNAAAVPARGPGKPAPRSRRARSDVIDPGALCQCPAEILLDVDDAMAIMQEEVFGPILPVLAVDDDTAAIERIGSFSGPWQRPAMAWYFGADRQAQLRFAQCSPSATVLINPRVDGADPAGILATGPEATIPGSNLWSGVAGFHRFSAARRLVFE